MAATTISDLPRDALVLIFRAAHDAAALDERIPRVRVREAHENLRRVSREWRDAADTAYIERKDNSAKLKLRNLRNPAAVRARFPSMIRRLTVDCGHGYSRRPENPDCRAPTTALAVSSLCGSAELRRVLKRVTVYGSCCADDAAAAVSAIVACPHLTSVDLSWNDNPHGAGPQPNMLAPLTALTGLKELAMESDGAWPALPDIPSLSSLELKGSDCTFTLVCSDASLGRLRCLSLEHYVSMHDIEQWASNDPLRLRAAVDDGTWRPHLLTGVQVLKISMAVGYGSLEYEGDDELEPDVFRGAAPAAAVWAPLAATVTKLELGSHYSIHRDADLETGMYAGLGVLTGLRALVIDCPDEPCCLVDFGRVHLPHLTFLYVRHLQPPIDLARFPRLVHVEVGSSETEPLVLSSVAALGRLESLDVWGPSWPAERGHKPRPNLAQLFGWERPLAALTKLSFKHVALSWDATTAPGALTAPEFAARARALLPSLRSVKITDEVEMDEGVREFVVPAVLALGRG